MRTAVATLVMLVLAGLTAPPAGAWILLGADATQDPGQIALLVWGSGTFTSVDVTERVDGTDVPVRTVTPPAVTAPDGSAFSGDYYPRSARWRCDRLTRVFGATGHRADGTTETASFTLRTPSCRNRLRLAAPRRVRPGGRAVLVAHDRWRLGGVRARLCIRSPDGERRCRRFTLEDLHLARSATFRARRPGHWRVTVTTPYQTLRAVVSVGVPPLPVKPPPLVLTTGDSLMQSTDAILGDRLTGRARVRTDVHIGSKLSRPSPVDWARIPSGQVKRFRPAATVLFLGTNEGWPMKTPGGEEVTCCGEPWVAEYARRARRAVRTYLRAGRGAVVWINVPIARDPARRPINEAVNAGLARAVKGIERATVVDAATMFTPGGVYRDEMRDRGRTVRVREADGVHLSPDGAAIVVREVIEQLERLGVV